MSKLGKEGHNGHFEIDYEDSIWLSNLTKRGGELVFTKTFSHNNNKSLI